MRDCGKHDSYADGGMPNGPMQEPHKDALSQPPASAQEAAPRVSDVIVGLERCLPYANDTGHIEIHREFALRIIAALAPHAPAPVQAAPTEPMRVACITLDGTTLTIPVDQIADMFGGDEGPYTLTFKTMTRAEFEALGEFNGF